MVGDAAQPGLLESGFAGLADLLGAVFMLSLKPASPDIPNCRKPAAAIHPYIPDGRHYPALVSTTFS